MNIALFGGTFDPVHRGHLTVARAAVDAFGLKQVSVHSSRHSAAQAEDADHVVLSSLCHGLAGTGRREGLHPVAGRGPDPDAKERKPSYSLETVRRVKKSLGKSDHLYFLIGMDAFKDIAKWYKAENCWPSATSSLRRGRDIRSPTWRRHCRRTAAGGERDQLFRKEKIEGPLVLSGATLHLLPETHENVSATQIRAAAEKGAALKLRSRCVAEYIQKERLYQGQGVSGV